jgi:hypothetical protein
MKLARIRPGFVQYGCGLEPDEGGPAGRVAAVAAEGKEPRCAAAVGVEAFHWLDSEPVGQTVASDRQWPAEDLGCYGRRNGEVEAIGLTMQIVECPKMKPLMF